MSDIPSKLSSALSTGRLTVALWQNACLKILMGYRTLRDLIYQLKITRIQKPQNSNRSSITSENDNLQETVLSNSFLEAIKEYIPKFIFFSDFQDMLSYEYVLTEAQNSPIVKDFCKIAKLDLNTVISTNDSQRRKIILRRHSAEISGSFQDYWKQNKLDLVTELDGQKLNFGIKESQDTILFKPEQRSKGFQWFLSFYLRLNAERSKTNIILIDEPGLYLHAKAQEDVLKVLRKNIGRIPSYFQYTFSIFD